MDRAATKRNAAHLGKYLLLHAATAELVFVLWLALWIKILVPSFGLLVSLIAGIPMLYPLVAGVLLYKARQRLEEGNPDAPRWIRWSMGFALPGSLAVGVSSVLFVLMGVLNGSVASVLMFMPFVVIGLSSVFVLLRVLFKTDLDELMWAEADQPLDEALTYSEEEEAEVELDLNATFNFEADSETEDKEVESTVVGQERPVNRPG